MDINIENIFIDNFIRRPFRKRLMFELSGKKRYDGIGRFCHEADEILDLRYAYEVGKDIYHAELKKYLTENNYRFNNDCYYFDAYCGEYLDVEEAIDRSMRNMSESIILFVYSIAFIKSETDYGAPMKYLLIKNQ